MASKDDKKFYLRLWEEREHISEISGKHLGDEPNWWFFAHVLGKGAYPEFRHLDRNIMFMTQKEHFDQTNNTAKVKENPDFAEFFERAEELKEEYYKLKNLE